MSGSFIVVSFIKEIPLYNANTVEHDQMLRSDLGLHCLPVTIFWDTMPKWVNEVPLLWTYPFQILVCI